VAGQLILRKKRPGKIGEKKMAKVWQEVFCTKSGGGCGGFVIIKLNTALNHRAEIVCPKCGHKHIRVIVDGVVTEYGRNSGTAVEEICPTMAAWSKEPRTPEMKQHAKAGLRRREMGL
jgi:hypothetical protein